MNIETKSKKITMAKSIKKKEYDFKSKYNSKTSYKEKNFYFLGDAFLNTCKVPGPLMSGINMYLGHSDTSKTTALILAAIDAQKKGHLPVFIITERKWDFERAQEMGFEVEKNEDGEWVGDFIFNDDFDYIEQATDFMNNILDDMEKGLIDRSVVFLWDSVGTLPCKMTFDGKGGKMHNASVLADKISMGLAGRIGKTRKSDWPNADNPLTATLIVVNQSWVELPDNPFGQPEIKPKGGEALYFACSYVFIFGNQKKAGVSKLTATVDGRKVSYATRTKITVKKDHVDGVTFADGKIIAVHNGYIADTTESIEEYKEKYRDLWKNKFGGKDFTYDSDSVVPDDSE